MQAPNAQGLMGLMAQGRTQQQPQQPPMPSPMKASPMAGLGSVEERVAAYRGNPAPLQQRYQMSQDLLDLLALQKIKSEKDAAARQMQLAMSQQQAAQGMEPQTVAQQREKEVMDLTKNELAQQRGETAQHQVEQQQDNMKKMLGGIASAPGAAAAAQPRAMASGGIVAFDDGGDVPQAEPAADNASEDDSTDWSWSRALRAKRMREEAMARKRLEDERARNMAIVNATEGGAGAGRGVTRDPRLLGATPPEETAGTTPAAAPAPAPAPAAPVARPAPTAAPAPAAGIAGLPGANTSPAAPAGSTAAFGNTMRDLQLKQAQRDPMAEQAAAEKHAEQKLAIDPAQQQAIDAANATRKREFETQYDPEKQRWEGIKQFLLGAGGRRYGVLGGGAEVAQKYDVEQRKAKLKEFEDMQKGIMEPFALKRSIAEKSLSAGQEATKQAGEGQRAGITGGYHMYNTDVNAAVERLKAQVQADANKINRENLDLNRAQTVYGTIMSRIQEHERKLDGDFVRQNGILLAAEQSGTIDPSQKQQLDVARTQLEIQKAQTRKELEPALSSARAKLGITSSQGWGELKTK